MIFRILLLSQIVLTGCSGYGVVDHKNPFERFGIKTLCVPTFVSSASISGVSGPVASEIVKVLTNYSDLDTISGESKHADAVLLGVISSEKISDTVKTVEDTIVSIGDRNKFYVPSKSRISFKLNLIMIKNPVWKKSGTTQQPLVGTNSEIIFNNTLDLTTDFARVVSMGEERVVNYTKNSGLLKRSVQEIAKTAATRFKNEIVNAF